MAHGRDTPGDGPGSLWLILLVCLVFFSALAYLVHQRQLGTYWTETDLYRWYPPDADRLRAGRFPPHNTYSPPGYPALLAALAPLTGDHFVTGKWLSLAAAALSGLVAFLLFCRLFGEATALLGVGILLLSGEYTAFAIQATTDVVFLLVCLVAMLVLTDDQRGGPVHAGQVEGGGLRGVGHDHLAAAGAKPLDVHARRVALHDRRAMAALLPNPVWTAVTEIVTHTPRQAAIGRNLARRHVRAVESATH